MCCVSSSSVVFRLNFEKNRQHNRKEIVSSSGVVFTLNFENPQHNRKKIDNGVGLLLFFVFVTFLKLVLVTEVDWRFQRYTPWIIFVRFFKFRLKKIEVLIHLYKFLSNEEINGTKLFCDFIFYLGRHTVNCRISVYL